MHIFQNEVFWIQKTSVKALEPRYHQRLLNVDYFKYLGSTSFSAKINGHVSPEAGNFLNEFNKAA